MADSGKRFRAFISYSQRDKAIARRLHRALETYRVPRGVSAPIGTDRRLGRFFRDDEEMGASQSLGAALEGALDDAEALIVICSPAAAGSAWVDAEVRHFKSRSDGRVFAVIASGQPHADDPALECFAPALKQRIGANGRPTGESDEPRAPDLHREGLARVVVQLAAGLLGLPFDDLWQRDRRRARWRALTIGAVGAVAAGVLAVVGLGWLDARSQTRMQAAKQSLAAARVEAADGRVAEAVRRLAPFLTHRDTQPLVDEPLRVLLGWAPDPRAQLSADRLQPVRMRDATVLLQPGQGAYDISDVGIRLERLLYSRDGRRLVAIGDQRVVVFDVQQRKRVAQLDNQRVSWVGQAFEAPNGLLVVTGAVLGPTNGSVWPHALTVSADGRTLQSHAIDAHMFWGSAAAVSAACDLLWVAKQDDAEPALWRIELRALGADGLSAPRALPPRRLGTTDEAAVAGLARGGPAFVLREAFMGEAAQSKFGSCAVPREEKDSTNQAAGGIAILDLGLASEAPSRWSSQPASAAKPLPPFRGCTERRPCRVVAGRTGEPFARTATPTSVDTAGWLPPGRWMAPDVKADPVFFEHLVFNSGHQLALCRPGQGGSSCLVETVMGEDQAELPLLRSPNGRFLYWPFAGAVFDLAQPQAVTPMRAIPLPAVPSFDFEADRDGLVIAVDARLVSFSPAASAADAQWSRRDDERASARFGVLADAAGQAPLRAVASLGARQYLAARADGLLVRLDATSGTEVWRTTAAGLGTLKDLQLDPSRRFALLIGEKNWRLFRLADGLPASGLLAPPAPVVDGKTVDCRPGRTLGSDGTVVAVCGDVEWTWKPRVHSGDMAAAIDGLVCIAKVEGSALEAIRGCFAK